MIRLTRLNHTAFYLNSDLIEQIETTPDTVLKTTNGDKILVAEPAEEVIRRIIDFRRRIHLEPHARFGLVQDPES